MSNIITRGLGFNANLVTRGYGWLGRVYGEWQGKAEATRVWVADKYQRIKVDVEDFLIRTMPIVFRRSSANVDLHLVKKDVSAQLVRKEKYKVKVEIVD